ncbi:MAG: flagellar basal body L-ring protein FlgH [Phycisphaerales bacterium]|nr:flagellar basal body L-ring protein FlgH [Phycisphaerales bacterium]
MPIGKLSPSIVRTAGATLLGLIWCALSASAVAQNLYTDPNATRQPTVAPPAAPRTAPPPAAPGDLPPQIQPSGEENPAPTAALAAEVAPGNPAADALAGVSLFVVTPPLPRKFAKHDLIEVIVNESSVQKFDQKSDLKKNYSLSAELKKFPSLAALITNLELREGIGSPTPQLGLTSKNNFKGEGKFDRKDQVTARITATVLDVKPNGNLVLEARESIQSNKEVSTMVLAGTCRSEDITKNNTIQSSQLAGLTIKIENTGDVKDSSEKGFIPRVLEAVFNF